MWLTTPCFRLSLWKPSGQTGDGELTSYKAPWETDKCQHAVATTGLYEAAVNITWLDARQRTKIPFDLPMTKSALSAVHNIYERQFSKEAGGLGGVTPNAASRLYFPVSIPGLFWMLTSWKRHASMRAWFCLEDMLSSMPGMLACIWPCKLKVSHV